MGGQKPIYSWENNNGTMTKGKGNGNTTSSEHIQKPT